MPILSDFKNFLENKKQETINDILCCDSETLTDQEIDYLNKKIEQASSEK